MEKTPDQRVLDDLERLPTLKKERDNRIEQLEVLQAELEILEERIYLAEKTTHCHCGVALSAPNNDVTPVVNDDNYRSARVYESVKNPGNWQVDFKDCSRSEWYDSYNPALEWPGRDEALMIAFDFVALNKLPKEWS